MARSKASTTLYDLICEATDEHLEEGETPAEFKDRLVKSFNGMDDEDFDGLPADVQTWANEAIDIAKANRGAKRQKPLPDIEGLPGDDDESGTESEGEVATKSKRSRASKGDDEGAEDEAPTKAKAKPKAEKKADAPKEKGARAPRSGKDGGPTKRQQLEKLLSVSAKNAKTHQELMDELGWASGCLTTARSIAAALEKELVKIPGKDGEAARYHLA